MLEDFRNVVQIISIVSILLVALQVYFSFRASIGKNTIDLINMLQAQHVRVARTYVIQKISTPFPFGDFQAEEAAATVVAAYDIAAILIREKHVDRRVFVDDFGPSVIKCYDALEEFIKKRQEQAGPRYWNDIGELARECKKLHSAQGINSTSWTGMG